MVSEIAMAIVVLQLLIKSSYDINIIENEQRISSLGEEKYGCAS